MFISDIKARQILDSRGNPTVEADVWVDGAYGGRAAVPSGASTGEHEAHELRDGESAFHGKSVLKAVANIHEQILPSLVHKPVDDQQLIDQLMIDLDGTANKSRLGANAILAVSLAVARAAAQAQNKLFYTYLAEIYGGESSIPTPMMNVLNGGAHATNSADFQEFMIVPHAAESYAHMVQVGSEIFQELRSMLINKGMSVAVGDEGGFTFPVKKNTDMLDFLTDAIGAAGYEPGKEVGIALDVAASEFYKEGIYELAAEKRTLSSQEMVSYLADICEKYPIVSIEDGLEQDDWDGWQLLRQKLKHIQLVGDDLLVTNSERLEKAISLQAANAILIKPNQVGTLTETLQAIRMAQDAGWRSIISHRSGETEDVTIAHLAIATGAGQIKTGSLSRSERTAKHNEIMRIASIDTSLKMARPFAQ